MSCPQQFTGATNMLVTMATLNPKRIQLSQCRLFRKNVRRCKVTLQVKPVTLPRCKALWCYLSQHINVSASALLVWWHPVRHLREMIFRCHVVLKHARGDDLGSPCPIRGLQVPEYPLCASCSEWGIIALLAKIHMVPQRCGFPPTLGMLPSPPAYCLHDPTNTT